MNDRLDLEAPAPSPALSPSRQFLHRTRRGGCRWCSCPVSRWVLCVVTGFGAVVFRGLIAFVHNLLFLGQVSFNYDTSVFTPMSPWGAFVILVPVKSAQSA